MSFGFGFGFTKITAAIRAAFSPSSLFAANEPGVWYDPSDFSTLFQGAAGTVPVTAVEQPVGLMLDKSRGLVLGPELVTNGDFSNGTTGWTLGPGWGISGGAAEHVVDTTGSLSQTVSAVAGRFYEVSFNVASIGGLTPSVFARIGSGSSNVVISGTGQKRFIQTPTGATPGTLQISASNSTSAIIDNISVRELPGNHAYQTTTTSRPVLSARVNLLMKTERFDDAAAWAHTGVTVVPNAGGVAYRVVPTTENGTYKGVMTRKSIVGPSSRAVCRFEAKPAGYAVASFVAYGNGGRVAFDLINNTAATYGNVSMVATVENGADDYKICTVTYDTVQGGQVGIGARPTVADGTVAFAGDGISGILLKNADVRYMSGGTGLPSYQRVNTATDYDTVGFPHYLRFDGVDDWLVTPTITPGIDKAQVFAGVRRLQNVNVEIIAETGVSHSSLGAFYLVAELSNNRYGYAGRGNRNGSSNDQANINFFPSPDTAVLTATQDINGNTPSRIRRNAGAWSNSINTTFGGGDFLAYPLYIGRRAGTSFPFNGHIYGLIVRFGSNLPIETIENTENYINTKTRAY